MKYYIRISGKQLAWYVGRGDYCFASVGSNWAYEITSFICYFFKVKTAPANRDK